MKKEYREWIEESSFGRGDCAEATIAMSEAFPELRRVRGHYYCVLLGERPHWWLVAPDGSVVDPTSVQFPSNGIGQYVEWDESQPEPTGKCPNCGGYCYDWRTVCSDTCGIEYVAFIKAQIG